MDKGGDALGAGGDVVRGAVDKGGEIVDPVVSVGSDVASAAVDAGVTVGLAIGGAEATGLYYAGKGEFAVGTKVWNDVHDPAALAGDIQIVAAPVVVACFAGAFTGVGFIACGVAGGAFLGATAYRYWAADNNLQRGVIVGAAAAAKLVPEWSGSSEAAGANPGLSKKLLALLIEASGNGADTLFGNNAHAAR